jgi:ABC-type multidrug transport system fused ATPase/permease subunit
MDGWVGAVLVVSLLLAIFAMAFLILSYQAHWVARHPDLRSQRVARLTQSLTEALDTIEGIKHEVEEGEALLKRLKADTESNKELAGLSQAQADAVNSALASALRRDRRGVPTIAINLAYAGVGAVAGAVIGHFLF